MHIIKILVSDSLVNLHEAQWQAKYPHLQGVWSVGRRYSSSLDDVRLLFFGLEPVAGRSGFSFNFEFTLLEAHILGREHSAVATSALCPAWTPISCIGGPGSHYSNLLDGVLRLWLPDRLPRFGGGRC